MLTLTEFVIKSSPPSGIFNLGLIRTLFPKGTEQARTLMLNRAVHAGEIVRLRRGLFCLGKQYLAASPHPFVLANLLCYPSFISFESALSWHGLIPEAVYQIASVSTARSHNVVTPLGSFGYRLIPAHFFKAGVQSLQLPGGSWVFIASPLRAIADIAHTRLLDWRCDGVQYLTGSLRIELQDILAIDRALFPNLIAGLSNGRVKKYLRGLEEFITAKRKGSEND